MRERAVEHNVSAGFLIHHAQDIDLKGDYHIWALLLEKIYGVHFTMRNNLKEGLNPWGDISFQTNLIGYDKDEEGWEKY